MMNTTLMSAAVRLPAFAESAPTVVVPAAVPAAFGYAVAPRASWPVTTLAAISRLRAATTTVSAASAHAAKAGANGHAVWFRHANAAKQAAPPRGCPS